MISVQKITGARKSDGAHQRRTLVRVNRKCQQLHADLRAELIGSNRAAALGIEAHSPSPVLALCRALVEAGYDPASRLEAWRGDTLCLRVRSIGEAAKLKMGASETGRPVFKWQETGPAALPVRQNLLAGSGARSLSERRS